MKPLLKRMEREPEIFRLVDGLFVKVNGVIVMVRSRTDASWRVPIRGGAFKYGGDVVCYLPLGFWANRRANRAIMGFEGGRA